MMDAQAKKKALYREKLNARKLEKHIVSPIVRYNENDQPVCIVCDVVLKSDSLWLAHQVSRKHHEAINNLKANAAASTKGKDVKPEPPRDLPKPKTEPSVVSNKNKPVSSTGLPKPRPSSELPVDFFDNSEAKKPKNEVDVVKQRNPDLHKNVNGSAQTRMTERIDSYNNANGSPTNNASETKSNNIQPASGSEKISKPADASENKQTRKALPEGFFDDKDADLRARGITPVKLDVKDEYKEFEKLIQDDLKEVDNRMEEEEVDAAEMIEELESAELRIYKERVEALKRKKMELKEARSAVQDKGVRVKDTTSSQDESSSDDDSEENFTVDWRAKHI